MSQNDYKKPCLVDTGRGFSVYYQDRFLYSKYAPKKTIQGAVENLEILPGTLFVISSPLLWYGLGTLLNRLPENCFILALEKDFELYTLSKKILQEEKNKNPALKIDRKARLLAPEKIPYIVNIILNQNIGKEDEIPPVYNFRRAIYLEFSGGASFNREFYQNVFMLVQNAIGSFWKNRITLTRLGRLYSRNIFKNLANLPNAANFSAFEKKIKNPIFIFGAGESAADTLKTIGTDELEKCFVMCVDAALPVLSAFGIKPDAVVAVEGQIAIEKAYIGNANLESFIFADMASRRQVLSHSKFFSYFSSEFAKATFLEKLKEQSFFPKTIPALGSVGLTASYLALALRESDEIPIFAAGLDFDFSLGKTHSQNAPAHISRLISSNRLKTIANYDSAFKNGAIKAGKANGTNFFTDIQLSNYAKSFREFFGKSRNFFSCSPFGLNIGLTQVKKEEVKYFLQKLKSPEKNIPNEAKQNIKSSEKIRKEILLYLKNEESALEEIKILLSGRKSENQTNEDFERELEALLSCREYLFLHFPDGFKCDIKNTSFLKRVRSELDFFLKDIKNASEFLKKNTKS